MSIAHPPYARVSDASASSTESVGIEVSTESSTVTEAVAGPPPLLPRLPPPLLVLLPSNWLNSTLPIPVRVPPLPLAVPVRLRLPVPVRLRLPVPVRLPAPVLGPVSPYPEPLPIDGSVEGRKMPAGSRPGPPSLLPDLAVVPLADLPLAEPPCV